SFNKNIFSLNMQQRLVTDGSDPDPAVLSREQGQPLIAIRQAHRKNICVAELYQSVGTANPNVAFAILEKLADNPTGETLLFTEQFQFGIMKAVPAILQLLWISDANYSHVHIRDP